MQPVKILIVDDEPGIRNLVMAYMRKEKYEVYEAEDGMTALKLASAVQPDLIILDIMLPGMNGLDVLTHIRKESDAYVILLTARSEEIDRVAGLSIGADDYVTKPFSPRELVARVKAALRRLHRDGVNPSVLNFAHLRIDCDSRMVWEDGRIIELTALEFDLLKNLAEHRGIVMSRDQLLDRVWGANYFGETRVVDVHVGNMRRKMKNTLITTIRGVGYRFDDEVL